MLASGSPFLQMALRKYSQASNIPDFQSTLTMQNMMYFFAVPQDALAPYVPILLPFFHVIYLFPYPSFLLSFFIIFYYSSQNYQQVSQPIPNNKVVIGQILLIWMILYCYLMLVINKSKEEGFFGRHQKIVSILLFAIAQFTLHAPIFVLVYAVFTLDLHFFIGLLALVIIQLPLRRSQRYIDIINKFLQPIKYFDNFEIIYEEIITQQDRCIFGVHPHSVLGLSLLLLMNSTQEGPLAHIIGLGSRFILNFPITGAILKLWGVQAVDHKNLKQLMKEGKNIGLLPGGFEEATLTTPDQIRCWINNRKGFIKYALENGYTIYPVMMMNQHKAFCMFEPWLKFRLFLNKLKFPGVLFWNKWTGILLPPWLSLHVVIGKGIKRELKNGEVTQALIDETHQAYLQEILRIYDKYAHLNGNTPIKIY